MDILGVRIVCLLGVLVALVQLIKPEIIIKYIIRWHQFWLKLFGFNSVITPTLKATIIYRLWALLCLVLFVMGLIGSYLIKK